MRVNLEIRDADMTFSLHLFILRGDDIDGSHVYPFLHFPAHPLDPNHGYPLKSFLLNRISKKTKRR